MRTTSDIALIADSIKDVQNMLRDVETAATEVGLKMNESKTKCMTANICGDEPVLAKSGDTIEKVENFLYLGS